MSAEKLQRFQYQKEGLTPRILTYPDRRDLQREFPELEEEDIREALAYAAAG